MKSEGCNGTIKWRCVSGEQVLTWEAVMQPRATALRGLVVWSGLEAAKTRWDGWMQTRTN